MTRSPSPHPIRKIIHIDMDAFFASVEQRDHPPLRGRPVAVGSPGARGVVAAASYEARVFGVHSAMPSATARRKCPDLIFVPPRFDVYRRISGQIRHIFLSWTPLVEPLALDEAYLDVTADRHHVGSATRIAQQLRATILAETGLTASAGISYNKFLAKLASNLGKPNGQAVIRPEEGPAFVLRLPVEKFHGIGPATARKMHQLGIRTGDDLRRQDLDVLIRHFGKAGARYHDMSRGIDHRPVDPDRPRKSISTEDTFLEDIDDVAIASERLTRLAEHVWEKSNARRLHGRTVTIKVKYADFRIVTRSRTEPQPIADEARFLETALHLLAGLFPTEKGVRLIGVGLSSFEGPEHATHAPRQFLLWPAAEPAGR